MKSSGRGISKVRYREVSIQRESPAGGWWIHSATLRIFLLLLFWLLFANFKDLGMCHTAPMSSLVWELGKGEFYPETEFCVGLSYALWSMSPVPCPPLPSPALWEPPGAAPNCGDGEQLIPCAGKHKTANQGCAWETTSNVKHAGVASCWTPRCKVGIFTESCTQQSIPGRCVRAGQRGDFRRLSRCSWLHRQSL